MVHGMSISAKAINRGLSWPTPKVTSSVSFADGASERLMHFALSLDVHRAGEPAGAGG
jgi:hypothetical protein